MSNSGQTRLTACLGDITDEDVAAVVNAANSSLLGGGGVDGAIHRRGGREILAATRRLRQTSLPDGLPAGEAVATTAGALPARWVIHTVGPVWSTSQDRSAILATCYRRSLAVAAELGANSIAFPAISAGVYGWPMHDAARIAVGAVRDEIYAGRTAGIAEIRFVLFSPDAHTSFATELGR